MQSAALALTRELISRKSLTPNDAGCQQLIADLLAPHGFVPEWFNAEGVTNCWLRRGLESPVVAFAGHTDVVPTGPEWDWHGDPFVALEKNGKLYGRGVADMKLSVGAMALAAKAFVEAHPEHTGSIALLLTSDEEGPATHGTRVVVDAFKARGERIDYCIVGEPSSVDRLGDTIKNGRRGSLSGRLTVRGVQGHVAYPDLVKNPIHLAAPALAEMAATVWDEGNDYFPPTSFQISNIKAGTGALNEVPGTLLVDFNFRFSTASTDANLRERVGALLTRHGLDFSVDWTLSGKPFLTPKGSLVAAMQAAIQSVTGIDNTTVSTTGGTSDGRFIADICAQVAEFGPINRSIHKINEYVDVADFGPLAQIYTKMLENLLLTKS